MNRTEGESKDPHISQGMRQAGETRRVFLEYLAKRSLAGVGLIGAAAGCLTNDLIGKAAAAAEGLEGPGGGGERCSEWDCGDENFCGTAAEDCGEVTYSCFGESGGFWCGSSTGPFQFTCGDFDCGETSRAFHCTYEYDLQDCDVFACAADPGGSFYCGIFPNGKFDCMTNYTCANDGFN